MKKYLLLLITAISFGQASNQMVSFTQAQSLGFSLKAGQSHVTSNQCMTKSEALAKYNLDTAAMSSYASNQLVPRSAWVNGVVGILFTSNYTYYNNSSEACNSVGPYNANYYTVSGLVVGARIYSDQACTSEVTTATVKWFTAIEGSKKISWILKADKTVEFADLCLY